MNENESLRNTDIYKRLNIFMKNVGKDSEKSTLHEMFEIHNLIFPDEKEHNKTCATCQLKVYNRLKKWWIENR